MAIWIF